MKVLYLELRLQILSGHMEMGNLSLDDTSGDKDASENEDLEENVSDVQEPQFEITPAEVEKKLQPHGS